MNLDNDIVGYDADGNPVTAKEFVADVKLILKQLEEGTLETYSTEEVRQMIFGSDNS
ncbi:hypothetical protein AAEO56_13560 [Flavobacterium sp. DGU11]|uniref:Uncharacterized protein n=1 Tax=Flavobacterium arundinis TaxID=3139143 RepID=A0ABU9HYQ5_9FLAO